MKLCRVVRLPWQAPTASRLFEGAKQPGCHKWQWHDGTWPKWYATKIIDIYLMSPSVCLWKTVQHRQDYIMLWLIKFRTQHNTKTGPQTEDVWRILWRQCELGAIATGFLRRPYATPGGSGFDMTVRYMRLQLLCLTDCIEICPYF